MRSEVQTLEHMDCWEIVRSDPKVVPVQTKLVLKCKQNDQGPLNAAELVLLCVEIKNSIL